MDETGYSRLTVSSAVRYNTRGVKAEHVRQIFRKKYLEDNEQCAMNNEQLTITS